MERRIRCQICKYENAGHCEKKNETVKISKSRRCDFFEMDLAKTPVKRKPKTTYIPYHFRDRHAYKKFVKEQEAVQQTQQQAVVQAPDCLSRFRSTAGEGECQTTE